MVEIELKQEDNQDKITGEVLLDSGATELVISLEFTKKDRFKKKKLKRLVYVRSINGIFNHEEPNEYIMEVELFYKEHKKRIEIDVIGEQK